MAWTPSRMTVWFTLLLHFLTNHFILGKPSPIMEVFTHKGILIGFLKKTQVSGKNYYEFLGVPYAKSPTGELRFKAPVEIPRWSDKKEASSNGKPCMQFSPITNKIIGDEDCLYLNIFVPYEENDKNKAVMVYIHEGAFIVGSGSEYSPDYLLDVNVIVITLNYRLNIFGFLNLDIEDCPGNMGLKDQWLAIVWVKENISLFGGDPQNITIFGDESGAASVHAHIFSPQSKGLFQKAIMQSGCMFNSWALNVRHKEAAIMLAKHFECNHYTANQILWCLQLISANELIKFTFSKKENTFLEYPFIPSIESTNITYPFLSDHPIILRKSAYQVPLITGLTDLEGFIGLDKDRLEQLGDFQTADSIRNILRGSYTKENFDLIMNNYFNKDNLKCEKTRWENIVNLQSDMYYVKDFHRAFLHFIQNEVESPPVYNYLFKYDGKMNSKKIAMWPRIPTKLQELNLKGACNGDDLSYLFYSKFSKLLPKPNSPELRMCELLSKLWSNFAKYGDPNSLDLDFKWEKTSKKNPRYLSIDGDNTKMVKGILFKDRINLWKNMLNIVRKNQIEVRIKEEQT